MRKILNNDQIISYDEYYPKIDMKSKKSPFSYSTAIDARGKLPSRDTSYDVKSSKDLVITYKENSEIKDEPNNDNNDDDYDEKDVIVNSYISKIRNFNLNEKLSSFYQGKFNKQTHYSYEITNVESSTIISYRSSSSNLEDCLICEFAYTLFDEKMKAHVLNLSDIEIETGFYLPVTTMHFHHDDKSDQNKLYLCGDVRVKEFTIEGLDNINNKNYQDEIVIRNSNTFYFGKHDFESSVITVWEDELVLGYGNDLYFWDIENKRKIRNKKEKLKIKQKDYKEYGIDIDKVDLTKGKCNKSSSIKLPNKTCQVSSFSVLKSSSSD